MGGLGSGVVPDYRNLGVAWKCNRSIKPLMCRSYLSTKKYRKYSFGCNLTYAPTCESALSIDLVYLRRRNFLSPRHYPRAS
jgi:hypothetical protein